MKERLKKWAWRGVLLIVICGFAIMIFGSFYVGLDRNTVPQKAERCTIFYSDDGGEPISLYCPSLGWLKAPFGPGQ